MEKWLEKVNENWREFIKPDNASKINGMVKNHKLDNQVAVDNPAYY